MDIDRESKSEALRTEGYELGIVAATEGFVDQLREKAGESFKNKHQPKANWLMELSDEIETEAKKLRSRYKEKYHIK